MKKDIAPSTMMDTSAQERRRMAELFPDYSGHSTSFEEYVEWVDTWRLDTPFRYTVQIIDVSNGKQMVELREVGLTSRFNKINPSDWGINSTIFNEFQMEPQSWFNYLDNNPNCQLVFAHSCTKYVVIDVDDPRDLDHPFIRLLYTKYPFVLSPKKRLPKFIIPLVNDKMPPALLTYDRRTTVKDKHGFHHIDILGNGFNYVPYGGLVYNANFHPDMMTKEDFADFPIDALKVRSDIPMPSISLPSTGGQGGQSPLLMDMTQEQFEACIELVAKEPQNNEYPVWIRILYIIKRYFPNDEGVRIAQTFSQLVDTNGSFDETKWIPFVGQDWTVFDRIRPDGNLSVGTLRYMAKLVDGEAYNRIFPSTLASYDEVKEKFERTNFKICNPVLYGQNLPTGLILRKPQELKDLYVNLKYSTQIKNEAVEKQFIYDWIIDATIRTYDAVDFHPGHGIEFEENGLRYFNAYRQRPPIDATPPTPETEAVFEVFVKLMRHLTGNVEESYEFLVKMIAHYIFKPHIKTHFILVFKSYQGAGKGLFWNFIGMNFIGEGSYVLTSDTESVFGRFNPLAKEKVLLVLDEAEGSKTFNVMNCIKHQSTEPRITINEKHKPQRVVRNFTNYVLLTNNHRAVKVEETDRRFVAFEACPQETSLMKQEDYDLLGRHQHDPAFIWRVMEFFQSVDISNFDVHNPAIRPRTQYYNDIQYTPTFIKFVYWLLYERHNVLFNPSEYRKILKSRNDYYDQYKIYCESTGFKIKNIDVFQQDISQFKDKFIFHKRTKHNNMWQLDEKAFHDYCILKKYQLFQFDDVDEVVEDETGACAEDFWSSLAQTGAETSQEA